MSDHHIIILFVSFLIIAFIAGVIESALKKRYKKKHEKRMMKHRKNYIEHDKILKMKRNNMVKRRRSIDW